MTAVPCFGDRDGLAGACIADGWNMADRGGGVETVLMLVCVAALSSALTVAVAGWLRRCNLHDAARGAHWASGTDEGERRIWQLVHALIEGTSDAVYVKDTHGRYLVFNSAAGQVVGKRPEEVIGKSDYEIFSPDDARQITEIDKATVSKGVVATYEEYLNRADGSPVVFLSTKGPIRDTAGRCIGLFGIARDITDRKKADESIAAASKYWVDTFNSMTDIVTVISKDHRILEINRAGCLALGMNHEDIIGRHCHEIVHKTTSSILQCPCSAVLRTGEMAVSEYESGGRWYRLTAWPIADEAGRIVAFSHAVSDITRHKQAEAERDELEAQIRQQQKLTVIGSMASAVAHEINNPVNGIINLAQLLHDRFADRQAGVGELCSEIIAEGERIAAIAKNLLSISRGGKGERAAICPGELVEGILPMYRELLKKDMISIVLRRERDDIQVLCYPRQVQQILLNIITNARDAVEERPGGVPKEIVISSGSVMREGQRYARLVIRDNGMGIPPAVQERMFEAFYTTKAEGRGTGLGLAISREMISEDGGYLEYQTWPGQGTEFFIDLPEHCG